MFVIIIAFGGDKKWRLERRVRFGGGGKRHGFVVRFVERFVSMSFGIVGRVVNQREGELDGGGQSKS